MRDPLGLTLAETVKQILEPVVLLRVDFRGRRRIDDRGVPAEGYHEGAEKIIHEFGLDAEMADIALGIFRNNHTLRLEATKLCYMQQFSSPTNLLLMDINAVALPFDPALLERLTIVMHGGSLSSCDQATFKLLRESVPRILNYFPSLKTLKFEVTWDVDEDQERLGPHYINLLISDNVKADTLPLIDVLGAQETCREWFHLLWQFYESCAKNASDIEVFSMGRSCVFNGKWEHDLEAAGFLFPNSNAWNPAGFQEWMNEYTMTHYQTDDILMEGEPIGVEVLTRGADVYPGVSDGYSTVSLAKSRAWVKQYPAIVAGQKAVDEREKKEREAMV